MSHYRILLVDDEDEIREGIACRINWEAIGFTLIETSPNGLDALEKAERLRPDVVMTDIRMPYMNGLEFGEKLRTFLPSVRLIFISGYDDFELAQGAIKLHASGYILKPVRCAELTEILTKVKEQMDEELANRRDLERLRKKYEESLPLLREQFLIGIIEGRFPKDRIRAQAASLHIELEADGGAVALLSGNDCGDKIPVLQGQKMLLPIFLQRTAREVLAHYCQFMDFIYSDCVVVIARLDQNIGIEPLLKGMNEVHRVCRNVLEEKVIAGISTMSTDFYGLKYSYREAQSALAYSSMAGGLQAVYIADVEPDTSVWAEFDESDKMQIINAIKLSGEKEISENIHSLFSRFDTAVLPLGQYQIFLIGLLSFVMKLVQRYDLDDIYIFGMEPNFHDIFEKYSAPEAMERLCTEICVRINGEIRQERVNTIKTIVSSAQQFIRENYSNPKLSVEVLCAFLHISPSYFSSTFKRETGVSFVCYLTDLRLKKAADLLKSTDDKASVIAGKVGFNEQYYFSYLFKKHFGVTPYQYRNPQRLPVSSRNSFTFKSE